MPDSVQFSLIGLEALSNKMDELTFDVKKRGGRFALRKAAQVVRDKAKENAKQIDDPLSREDISENIVERWSSRLFKRTGDLGFRVGVMGGAGGRLQSEALSGLPGGDTRHWRLVEFGTKNMAAQPFMRRALTESIDKATSKFITEFDKALDRAIKRAKK